MSDTKLRELERRWKETGTVADEAAYLLERVRAGNLTRERLELAAYCGHEGAISALGSDRGGHTVVADRAFVSGLKKWGKPPIVALAVAAAETIFENYTDGVRRRDALQALASAKAWLAFPNAENQASARTWGAHASSDMRDVRAIAVGACALSASLELEEFPSGAPEHARTAVEGCVHFAPQSATTLPRTLALWALESPNSTPSRSP